MTMTQAQMEAIQRAERGLTAEQRAAIERAEGQQVDAVTGEPMAARPPRADEPMGAVTPQTNTNLAEQVGSGVNEGLAAGFGLPVDAATALINGLTNRGQDLQMGFNPETGEVSVAERDASGPTISNPVGGSAQLREVLDPLISDVDPQTAAQRYGRAFGQDVGASAVPLAGAMSRAARPMSVLGLEMASSVGASGAQQAVEDAGGGAVPQVVAALLGGGAPIALARQSRPAPTAPSIDDVRARQEAAYATVDASDARMPQEARDELLAAIRSRTQADDLDVVLHPRANRMLERSETLPEQPTISDVERLRRAVGRDVAGAPDPSEARIGMGMRDEIDDFMRRVGQGDSAEGTPGSVVDSLVEGRAATRQVHAYDDIFGDTGATTRATRRAATSGTGGNEINAVRQNIRAILDNPRRRRGFTGPELEAMEDIVFGTPSINAARLLGRLSPTSGMGPLATHFTAQGAGAALGGLSGFALGSAPGVIGMGARSLGEGMQHRQVDRLGDFILNGGPVGGRGMTDSEMRAFIASLIGVGAQPYDQ